MCKLGLIVFPLVLLGGAGCIPQSIIRMVARAEVSKAQNCPKDQVHVIHATRQMALVVACGRRLLCRRGKGCRALSKLSTSVGSLAPATSRPATGNPDSGGDEDLLRGSPEDARGTD